jgi:threonine dehydrogenase-like Zn-dependent dehydrogenase
VLRVPDELPDEVACPANCATATVAAALRAGGECHDAVVLIQGAGMLGLTAAAMARFRGAREVIVADPDADRIALAEQFGATRAVHLASDDHDLMDVVAEATSGHGVDVAWELSGSPVAIEAGLPLVRIGGRYVLVGAVFPDRPVSLPAEMVVRRLLRIQGIHNYTPADLCTAVKFLSDAGGTYPFAQLVSGRFSLDQAQAAFEHALQSKAPRVAVVPKLG